MKQNLCIKVKFYPFPYSNSLKDEMLIGSMCPHAAALFPSILYLKRSPRNKKAAYKFRTIMGVTQDIIRKAKKNKK